MKNRLLQLQARKAEFNSTAAITAAIKNEPTLKAEIKELYAYFFHANLCDTCRNGQNIADGCVRLLTITEAEADRACSLLYQLVNGAIGIGGASDFVTNINLTNEKAERHLAKNPELIRYFAKYPSDWQERAARRAKMDAELSKIDTNNAENSENSASANEKSAKSSKKTNKSAKITTSTASTTAGATENNENNSEK